MELLDLVGFRVEGTRQPGPRLLELQPVNPETGTKSKQKPHPEGGTQKCLGLGLWNEGSPEPYLQSPN